MGSASNSNKNNTQRESRDARGQGAGIRPGETRVVSLDSLNLWPGNPRRGDVEVIEASLRANGQYVPIVVDRTSMRVLKGNHTVLAARGLGWTEIEARFV